MYKAEKCDSLRQLVAFINNNNIQKKDIVTIMCNDNFFYIVYVEG